MSREVLPDGTVVYRYKGHGPIRYKPPENKRKYDRRKPSVEGAVRFHTQWFLPLPLLEDDVRIFPATRPDEEGVGHKMLCHCQVCERPAVLRLKRKAAGLRPGS